MGLWTCAAVMAMDEAGSVTVTQHNIDMVQLRSVIKEERFNRLLKSFVSESNAIEGIFDKEEDEEAVKRMEKLLKLKKLTLDSVCVFNHAGELRDNHGINVRVNGDMIPAGSILIRGFLEDILTGANNGEKPFLVHVDFERLHPFMDGNGRTGRAIWLWQMVNQFDYDLSLGFIHKYYYQSLEKL